MTQAKSNIIFPKTPFNIQVDNKSDTENRKLNYWLEKLFIQRGKKRSDNNNRKEEQSNNFTNGQRLPDMLPNKKDQALTQSGINEYTKNIAIKNEIDTQKLNDLVRKSNRCIISISSQFPWTLSHNTIDVEESRVIFRFNQFLSSQSHSVDIKDISNVFIETSMFFATLQVVSRTYIENDIKIGGLNKTKARKVLNIIEGLRTFVENSINTSNYETDDLITKLEELHTNQAASYQLN